MTTTRTPEGWKTFLVFLLTLWIIISSAESVVLGQYEDYCTENSACHQDSGLTCQSHRCKCSPGGETVFSISKNRCVGAAGRECLRSGNETLCVDNSICRDYSYMLLCACKEGYYQSRNGNCYKIAKYGESCREEDYACGDSVTTSVSCVERKCRCLLGDEDQYFDSVENRCISYAGSQCLYHYSNPCAENSYCGEIAENINGASFVVGHRCLCKLGYSYSKNRRCLARFGNPCNLQNVCNYDEFLGCSNGLCQCRNPLNEVFDEKTGQCAILAQSSCVPDSGQKCVRNAECVAQRYAGGNNTGGRPSHRCECTSGFSVTPMNTCLLDINQKCQPGGCNYHNGLTCVNETCACVDSSLSFDKSTKMCVAMIGQPCGHVQVYDQSSTNSNEPKEIVILCEGNAICAKSSAYATLSSNGAGVKRICRSVGSSKKTEPIN